MSGLGDRGKWAEARVQEYLDARSDADVNLAWHRFPDPRAARGYMGSKQPADYVVAYKGLNHYLEVKETEHPLRLFKSKIGQYGLLKKFWLAGMPCYCVIYRSHHDNWSYFKDDELFVRGEAPPSFLFKVGRDFPTAASVLEHLYQP